MPVVTTFFLIFFLLEDSGYLPQLFLLVDRLFKTINLFGRAVIPIFLGLGCGRMATLVTPGISIALEQRFPSFVIKAGHTRLAIDKKIARSIYVRIG